ncbi:hypothetical protein BB561_003799 [Smittium simulii]|uniref:MTOR-associated protein MEAK7 n=1 Tax=Smittium simulii TaxID=133385 RepID=A0A2T9YJG6_9FUNG|nr:hypothetical protein BB561_003799 [Smittium simulii]
MGNAASSQVLVSPDSIISNRANFEQTLIKNSYKNLTGSTKLSPSIQNLLLGNWLNFVEFTKQADCTKTAKPAILSSEKYYSLIISLLKASATKNQNCVDIYNLLSQFNLPLISITRELYINALDFWQICGKFDSNSSSLEYIDHATADILFEFLHNRIQEFEEYEPYVLNSFSENSIFSSFSACFFRNFTFWNLEQFTEFYSKSLKFREIFQLALYNILRLNSSTNLILEQSTDLEEACVCCPQISSIYNINHSSYLRLDPYAAWCIQSKLEKQHKSQWSLIYCNPINGNSWNSFKSAIENKGHLLFIISQKSSPNIFGVYVESPIIKSPKWHGSSKNFFFKVDYSFDFLQNKDSATNAPAVQIFSTTGINSNFQYFNYGTTTLPNGLGFGGQHDFFGLWIDSSFTSGHSFQTATYLNKSPLSNKTEFEIQNISIYSLSKNTQVSLESSNNISAVSRNPEAVALLEMSNKEIYSKDFAENQSTL